MPRVKVSTARSNRKPLEAEVARLRGLDLAELRARWRTLFGRRPPSSLPRHLLFRVLAYRIQAAALGELDRDFQRLLDHTILSDANRKHGVKLKRVRGTLQQGTILSREWNGRQVPWRKTLSTRRREILLPEPRTRCPLSNQHFFSSKHVGAERIVGVASATLYGHQRRATQIHEFTNREHRMADGKEWVHHTADISQEIAANFGSTALASLVWSVHARRASITPGAEVPCDVVSSAAEAASSTCSSQMNSSWSRTSWGMSS